MIYKNKLFEKIKIVQKMKFELTTRRKFSPHINFPSATRVGVVSTQTTQARFIECNSTNYTFPKTSIREDFQEFNGISPNVSW